VLYAEGRRFDDLANTKRLGGYGLLDVRAEYRVDADWLLQGRVENLLGKRYETALYFNQPGRGLYFTLNYQPGN
jgi:vitamin B12 transporter